MTRDLAGRVAGLSPRFGKSLAPSPKQGMDPEENDAPTAAGFPTAEARGALWPWWAELVISVGHTGHASQLHSRTGPDREKTA